MATEAPVDESSPQLVEMAGDRGRLRRRRGPHRAGAGAAHQHLRAQAGGATALRTARRSDRGHRRPEDLGTELALPVRLLSQNRDGDYDKIWRPRARSE